MSGGAKRGNAGFTMLEALIGTTLLGMALMSQASMLVANTKLAQQSRTRSDIFVATREFMERLRAYDDWAGLYSQIRLRQEQAAPAYAYEMEGGGGRHPKLTTHDGRSTFAPSAYVPGFEGIADFGIVIEVPTNDSTDPNAPLLREDANLPAFKLPADLNGDGVIDDKGHEDDYRFLPIRAVFVWKDSVNGLNQQTTLTTWLRGDR